MTIELFFFFTFPGFSESVISCVNYIVNRRWQWLQFCSTICSNYKRKKKQ